MGRKVVLVSLVFIYFSFVLSEVYGEFVLMVRKDARKWLKNTNVSFAVVPEILCQLYTL